MRRVKGFTLIELLVVVAIIAGLIAIMVPALSRARKQARNVQCTTNQRSISQAFNVYVYDIGGQKNLYPEFLTLYVVPSKLLICPETRLVKVTKPNTSTYFGSAFETWARVTCVSPLEYAYGSYGANFYWVRPYGVASSSQFMFVPGVYNRMKPFNESVIPAFADGAQYELLPDERDVIPPPYAAALGASAMRRHGPMTNVAFADGHVEAVKLGDLWTLPWKSNWKRTDPYPVPPDWVYVPQQP